MMSTEVESVIRVVCLVLIIVGLLGASVFSVRVLLLCRRRGIALLKVEDKALSPASLQTALLLFATLIGGLWVVYTVAVSGTLELQQLTAERERRNQDPNIRIDLQLETLSASSHGASVLPLHIQAIVENKGVKEVPIAFTADEGERHPPPLLLIGRVEAEKVGSVVKDSIESLPYVSLDCPAKPAQKNCSSKTWKSAVLEPVVLAITRSCIQVFPPDCTMYNFSFQSPS